MMEIQHFEVKLNCFDVADARRTRPPNAIYRKKCLM